MPRGPTIAPMSKGVHYSKELNLRALRRNKTIPSQVSQLEQAKALGSDIRALRGLGHSHTWILLEIDVCKNGLGPRASPVVSKKIPRI